MLPCPVLYPVEGLLDVFQRIRDAETNETLTIGAERCTGKAGNAGFFEQSIRQLFRCPAGALDVRKHIECALGIPTAKSLDFVETLYHQLAPAAELREHVIDRRLIASQRLHACNLRKTRRAGIRVGHESRYMGCQI